MITLNMIEICYKKYGNPKDKQRQAGQGPQKVLRRTVGDDSGER